MANVDRSSVLLNPGGLGVRTQSWSLRYAPHIGYHPPETPLFKALVGADPVDHIHFAAQQGMAGILDPWAADRPQEQRSLIGRALAETGLEYGCISATPLRHIREPIWVATGGDAREQVRGHIANALTVARELGSHVLAVLIVADESSTARQRKIAIAHLREAADLTAVAGVKLAIEPMISFPNMLLKNFADGVELVRTLNHESVGLIFDTAHVAVMGEPVLETYVRAYDDIFSLQLADLPGRIEPGAGELEFIGVLSTAMKRGFGGLVELEHHWSKPGEAAERLGLELLRDIDRRAAAAARGADLDWLPGHA